MMSECKTVIIDDFVDSIESHLILNRRGVFTDGTTLSYIRMEISKYKKQKEQQY